ncbi:MAG: hypothetical protein JF570_10085 [Caulobacter sp.]|nr:hypothetical protein [Caulobacter sp.]
MAFKDPASVDYAFGAAWAQDQQGVKDLTGFKAWLATRQAELNATH